MAWRRIGDKPLSETMLTWFTDAHVWHWGDMSYVGCDSNRLASPICDWSVSVQFGITSCRNALRALLADGNFQRNSEATDSSLHNPNGRQGDCERVYVSTGNNITRWQLSGGKSHQDIVIIFLVWLHKPLHKHVHTRHSILHLGGNVITTKLW